MIVIIILNEKLKQQKEVGIEQYGVWIPKPVRF